MTRASQTTRLNRSAKPADHSIGPPHYSQLNHRYGAVYVVDRRREDYTEAAARLAEHDMRIKFLSTARSALRIPRYQSPLLFVVNTNLPDMSGFDLREMLVERWPGTPGYLVSDHYDPKEEIRARCTGATIYLCKPLEADWLTAALQPAVEVPPT